MSFNFDNLLSGALRTGQPTPAAKKEDTTLLQRELSTKRAPNQTDTNLFKPALYENDPTRATRRATLITEHDAKAKQSSLLRDKEIKAAKEKHLAYVKALDKDLYMNLRELDSRQQDADQKRFDSTRGNLNLSLPRLLYEASSHATTDSLQASITKQCERKHSTLDVSTKRTVLPTPISPYKAKEISFKTFIPFRLPTAKPPRESSEQPSPPDSQASEGAAEETPSTVPDSAIPEQACSPSLLQSPTSGIPTKTAPSLDREPGLPQNGESSSATLKRKFSPSPLSPGKKPRAGDSHTIPSYIETDPIRPKLTAYPFCFVSAWNVDVKEENLKLMRKMVEAFNFYPEALRADKTGYFLIFEASDKGERMAEECGIHFKKWKFRKQHMYPQFCARGTATNGV